jgi:hypothetical protein
MADTVDEARGAKATDAEARDKNLQLKATAKYQAAVLVLAKAHGYKTISDYLQFLLDREIAAAQAQIDDLDDAIDQRKAQEAEEEKAELRAALTVEDLPVTPTAAGGGI